jgi:transcriptional regulator with XRE-family HTH domain
MTFGEKMKQARLKLNLSQSELAAMTGISERSLYSYEQLGSMPRSSNLKKIADALNVSVGYLMDEDETDTQMNSDKDIFLANVKNSYGYKGAKEAKEVLTRASALFAGGDLNDEAKEVFFQSLMEVYLESKAEARAKFSPKQRKRKND